MGGAAWGSETAGVVDALSGLFVVCACALPIKRTIAAMTRNLRTKTSCEFYPAVRYHLEAVLVTMLTT